ncbi:MAG: glycosyltransferase family 4 protein [Acidimicrobiales bacterium]|nr:glycosyltransferase family 4 protein [Acidimicrobiales bacterium]
MSEATGTAVTARRVTLVEFTPSGGLFQFSYQLGQGLAELGHDVELVTGPEPELRSDHPRFRVLPILPTWHPGAGVERPWLRKSRRVIRAVRHVAAWAVVARHLRRVRPDVVQWSEWRFGIDGLLAAAIARRRWAGLASDLAHSPIPLEEQGAGDGAYRQGRLLRAGLARGYRAMDAVFVLGETSSADLQANFPEVDAPVVIPHGHEGIFDSGPVVPPGDCPQRVVLFGSLTRYKGIDVLLDAFAEVRRRLPEAELVVAGPLVGDLELEALLLRADRIGNVALRPGYLPIERVPELVGSARVFAAPYLRSNASGAVRLAQTLGRPVVVTDVGDLADSVPDGVAGLVVPPEDARSLAEALLRLLEDPRLADRMGAAGRDRLLDEGSWERVAARVSAVYDSVLDRPPISS